MDQPARIGRYALVRRVGAGGFATVWLARDEQLDAEVAVKILSDNWIDEDDVRRRFLAEGRFLRRVDSPYVVGVHDIGEAEDGRPYLVLTYADGGSLADRIKAGPLAIGEVVKVIGQVGSGLRQLHARGVLHRDVKPANVLFRTDPAGDRAMLGDLGLGKSLETVSQLTMPGGTPAYVAPEQVMGDRLDHRADLYSLGAVAYAAFTGQAPHGVNSLGAVMRIDAPPPSMTTLREDIPEAIDVVVRRALEPDRDRRWPDLASFLTALDEAHRTGKIPADLVPADREAATGPGALDQQTQLGNADHPTVAASADTAGATSAAGTSTAEAKSAAGTASDTDAATAAVEPAGGGGTKEPRRTRAWLVAVVLAVLLAAGGGYGGYQLVMSRPVTVIAGRLAVDVPRDWNQKAVATDESALLVSTRTDEWQSTRNVPGVFLGVVSAKALPTTSAAPSGCTAAGSTTGEFGGKAGVTFEYRCADVLIRERFVQISASQLLRIQVRTGDPDTLAEVTDSATYTV
ncbi:protein kinase-like protein [Kribbella amoyensis]|uniref:non-specific serine/threonine protein kinase n=1 Tax=Kribbella amoyensis TaxID=996641 RepID=A0A561BQW8_9ACTN|nr:serine/threonine-protein kinase [Kribbella amoyensis]TWD81183.1 protein kinase-like protein [Kribbella amoyensis]